MDKIVACFSSNYTTYKSMKALKLFYRKLVTEWKNIKSSSTEISLQQRIEYLSRATMSAKSSTMRTSSASEGEFLHELEEKMEVHSLSETDTFG